jgi:glyoxylase-like metal-dependent hydrolase (beta-lactamase superfamily II)
MAHLSYESLLERREGLTRDLPAGDNEDLRWVTNSATLIMGENDAVLVDTFTTIEQNERLVEWVRAHDQHLTYVYLTHGHGDHVYGIGQVLEAFPGARAVGTEGTVAEARLQATDEYRENFWGRLFPGQIPEPVLPEVLSGDTLLLEGSELRVIEAGYTDTEGTTSLWVPDLGMVVAGDVAYNNTHMYLAETTSETRLEWVTALRRLKTLNPTIVVAGHKDPSRDDSPTCLDESIQYLLDFEDALAHTTTALELYQAMLRKHGRRANPGSLWGVAKLTKGAPTPVG